MAKKREKTSPAPLPEPASVRDLVPGFGEMVNAEMRSRGWSPYTLAKHADVGVTTIYSILNGRRGPTLRVAMLLADALDLDVPLRSPVVAEAK
jgi:ribosome-binding protein aMBF1 (putative translation factor)